MLKKRITKIALVLTCIMTMLMPYTTPVLAAKLTSDDTTVKLQSIIPHEGGEEASGTLTETQLEKYDETPYGYTIDGQRVFKIVTKNEDGTVDFSNIFYCLNAKKSFPAITSEGNDYLDYTKIADFKDSTDSNVKALHLSTSYADDNAKWTSNYKSLVWLVNNMYLRKETPEQKDNFLAKAFENNTDSYDLETVKAFLTDDDIEVVQQYAIWYFTNNDTDFNKDTLPNVDLTKYELTGETTGSYNDITGSNIRQDLVNYLYQYLITSAKDAATKAEEQTNTYPQISTDENAEVKTDNDHYVVGPFKVTSGTVASTEYTLKLVDQDKKEIARSEYKILVNGETEFSDKNIDQIFDKDYYIYLPKTNTVITEIVLNLSYSKYETKSTVWENNTVDENNVPKYQPVVLLTREKTPFENNIPFKINRDQADLALRKYIIKVNDKQVNRQPIVDISKLKNGTSKTAEYKHAKDPIAVSAGDKVVYEIRVYNEADIDATGTVIVDALPAGLEYVEGSQINETYGWTKTSTVEHSTVYSTDYLKGTTIEKFDKKSDTELDSKYVQIECKIADAAKASTILTNVAEIAEDSIDDRDSTPADNDYTQKDIDSSNYTGDNNNKEDLTDKDYYYKGRQDDDDFEKVKVEGKSFDLNLKKFITKINKSAPKTSREPVVDLTKLKNGTSTNAEYAIPKTPLIVEKGDIVLYTIRVYNEGELSGYAEEVSDYLPEGLGFLVGYTTNVDNYWSIAADSKTVKLDTIENGTKNLSVDDFNDIEKLSDVDVVVGKAKITSTKLKSSVTDNKNLIKAFDKVNGTQLDYRDIQVACIVLTDEVSNYNLRNIAEIKKESDENKNEITDIDSTPDTVNPDDYPGEDSKQDDNDYENLTTVDEEFDLSLQKFITKLNDKAVTGRAPTITKNTDGKLKFTSTADALSVVNNDLITYTIRVYNEGTVNGYAKEISDDLPKGLEYVINNETNKKYGWKLYDKNGNETTDLSQAVTVKTNYLSKEASEKRNDNCLLEAFNPNEDVSKVDYEDVEIVFKVVESAAKDNTGRNIINTAEITDDEDENGKPIEDIDSTPGNNKDGEDDIDKEKVYVKYFDLSLQKDLIKIVITEDGKTREIAVSSTDGLQKVEIHRKRIKSTIVKFVYNITVKNEGEIAGYATEITDYIPEGLEFVAADNSQWTQASGNVIKTNALANTLLQPGKSASVQVTLKWINGDNNFGLKTNIAEISADKNDSNTPDIDSTPGNKKTGEDDIDSAEVMLSISTGTAPTYIALTTTVLMILTTGIILIKKYVL